jgi:Ca-activated chloride channel family protein
MRPCINAWKTGQESTRINEPPVAVGLSAGSKSEGIAMPRKKIHRKPKNIPSFTTEGAIMLKLKFTAILLAAIIFCPAAAYATGFVTIEGFADNCPVFVENVTVYAKVSGLTAEISIEETLVNTTDKILEGNFLFPVPDGGAFRSFSMSMDNEMVEGKLCDAKAASEIYRKIVSSLRDPGLLQFMGTGLYQFSIYPLPAKGKKVISFKYAVPLTAAGECTALKIPLKQAGLMKMPICRFAFNADIEMPAGLTRVSSTAYALNVRYDGFTRATAGMVKTNFLPQDDLDVLISSAGRDFSRALLTCKGEAGGYFCLEIASAKLIKPGGAEPKDVTYILDVSGSMGGEKLDSSKNAIAASAAKLNSCDRFRLAVFSDDARFITADFMDRTEKNLDKFAELVNKLGTEGGTNMEAGLRIGIARAESDASRLHYVVLISDGEPNNGLSGERELSDLIGKSLKGRARLFSIGAGGAANMYLLNALAARGGGFSDFVSDDEPGAERMKSFMDRFNCPVLEDFEVTCSGVGASEIAPEKIPALFAGESIRIYGRYAIAGTLKVSITGSYLGEKKTFEDSFDVEKDSVESPGLPVLWASRRVASLLDRIRLDGASELENEAAELAGRYGIVTPYTSYLVLEKGSNNSAARSMIEWWNSRPGGASGGSPAGASGGTTSSDANSMSSKMFGGDVNAARIVFLLDVSGSMSEPSGVGENAAVSKFDAVKKELSKVISALPRHVSFNVVVFNSAVRSWKETLVPADDRAKASALEFIGRIKPTGDTHMSKAFEAAFAGGDFDALYFVSDGAPRENARDVDPKTVLDSVELLNRFKCARIYATGFPGAREEFMKQLASAGSGAFCFVKDMKFEVVMPQSGKIDPLSSFPDTPEIRLARRMFAVFSASAAAKLAALAVESKEVNTYRAVIAGFSALETDRDKQIVCNLLTKSKDYRIRILSAGAAGNYRKFSGAVDALRTAALREKEIPAFRAEVDALLLFRDKQTVSALADLWAAIEGKTALSDIEVSVKNGLFDMTGVNSIPTARDFLKWWNMVKDSFMLPQSPASGNIAGQRMIGTMRDAGAAEELSAGAGVRHVGEKTFVLKNDTWTDTAYREGADVETVEYLSVEYWRLAEDAAMAKYLAVGEKVLVCMKEGAVRVVNKK